MAESAVGRARGIRSDPDLGPRHARRRRRRAARRVRGIARRRPRQRAGAARRDPDGRLAARASRDRSARRPDDDRPDPRRRPYRTGRGHAARPGAAGAVRAQCRAHRRARAAERRRVGGAGAGERGHDQPGNRASPASRATRSRSTARARPPPLPPPASTSPGSCSSAPPCGRSRWPARSNTFSTSRCNGRWTAFSSAGRSPSSRPCSTISRSWPARSRRPAPPPTAPSEAIANHGVGNETTAAEVAIAKIRVGEAAGNGAAIAHQVHGAMGFTYEHSLHQATRRLWSWREEFGNEAHWADRLGHMVAARGADALWPFVTGT